MLSSFSAPIAAEPTTSAEAAAKKALADAKLVGCHQAHVATLTTKRQPWEKELQENLGGFDLPIHKRRKIAGKSNA